jgi:hypothetical protein
LTDQTPRGSGEGDEGGRDDSTRRTEERKKGRTTQGVENNLLLQFQKASRSWGRVSDSKEKGATVIPRRRYQQQRTTTERPRRKEGATGVEGDLPGSAETLIRAEEKERKEKRRKEGEGR